jgi:molybdopterin-containing oxidoreductase family membrane subunit
MSEPTAVDHSITYPRFAWRLWRRAFEGGIKYYTVMTVLTCVFLVGVNAWAEQLRSGMVVTNLTDQVSWGLYIANFTFAVTGRRRGDD